MADRLRANGKKACVIVAAVANRWIRKLFRSMCEPTSSPDVSSPDVSFLRHGQKTALSKFHTASRLSFSSTAIIFAGIADQCTASFNSFATIARRKKLRRSA